MIRRLLAYSLTILFAFQTIGIVLDDYQPHQIINDQIVFDHDSQKLQASNDCHHCCHCHGTAQLNPSTAKTMRIFSFITKPFSYGFNHLSIPVNPLYRPPIHVIS